jgi:predicted  nucleic acid-binding Zn-ribbon protein
MSTIAIPFDLESIHASFRTASAEQELLDAQLSESLAALAAYQSHLDGWQQQLANERAELQQLREQTKREMVTAQEHQLQAAAPSDAELATLRQSNCELAEALRSREVEVWELNARQEGLATDLELAHAQANELRSALDDQQRTINVERATWEEELKRLHELLEQRAEAILPAPPAAVAASPPALEPPRSVGTHRESSGHSAVLGSIVEQFGKLRQQRAIDRQGSKKTR